MMTHQKQIRALGLCSGGLDSMLAGLVLREHGIAVEWVTFETPFFSSRKARDASRTAGIPLTVKPIFAEYIQMLRDPNCGYGRNMNPCLDCHALRFRLAGKMMREQGFDFLFSGEVLGQRPMSQTRPSLRYVEKNSGFEGYILRPLSAKRLPETIPEKNGWVDRELLYDFAGRGRKAQIELAKRFGITDYPAPAGGCLLTDKGYSRRLKDLFDYQQTCTEAQLHLLRYGRHFRLSPQTKLIVGRTAKDNEELLYFHDPTQDAVIDIRNRPSPTALVTGNLSNELIFLGASVCAGYSKAPRLAPVEAVVITPQGQKTIIVLPIAPEDVKKKMI